MTPPLISYIAFNRLGLTARNLKSILDTPEDFEMHIIDSNSKDDTWDYIQSVNDPRIKSKTRFPVNSGPIYGLNLNLTKRRPDQYFFTIDNDVYIKTKDWLTRFMRIFEAFPGVGALGVQRTAPYIPIYPKVIPRIKDGLSYLELEDGHVDVILDFVHGCLMGLRPELIQQIGYWSEENCFGDAEICARINNYTSFKCGFMTDVNYNPMIDFDMAQTLSCNDCIAQQHCKLDKYNNTCFSLRNRQYINEPFVRKFKWKYLECFKELAEGKRTAYCGSIFDAGSRENRPYHMDWALENFSYYIENSNG